MASGDVLASFLWRARSGIWPERLPLFGGHGVADASYRSPRGGRAATSMSRPVDTTARVRVDTAFGPTMHRGVR